MRYSPGHPTSIEIRMEANGYSTSSPKGWDLLDRSEAVIKAGAPSLGTDSRPESGQNLPTSVPPSSLINFITPRGRFTYSAEAGPLSHRHFSSTTRQHFSELRPWHILAPPSNAILIPGGFDKLIGQPSLHSIIRFDCVEHSTGVRLALLGAEDRDRLSCGRCDD